ncbi:MAG: hypothetical protein H6709_10780 [Kofleriaceae bacterium]|nr:hypothetical protein [Myxococcales bacterium]MCB9564072.1 hypothetical protein [Kofleriaceae bacterium]MCB9572559.1 hypothetical protein [Kofleriaceae bacterium]
MLLVRRVIASIALTALVSAPVISCGPAQKPTGGGATTGGTTTVDALKTKAPPNQAIVLGTDAGGGSTAIALSDAEATVTVDSMWVRLGQPVTGGSSPVKLTAAPNSDGSVRVGFYEEFAGGIGPQWRAGVWLAAFIGSTTLNKDLTDFKFTAEAGGNVDGASASGLMTAGFLAAITGTTIDPKATMTGIINPDGTIGPVGGIPQKFTGSIELGKKRLGFPIGMRYSQDLNTGEAVDLVKLAKDAGAEAVEVPDVYAAYELMTGKKLPRPVPVEENEMDLEAEVVEAYDAAYTQWQTDLGSEWDRLLELDSAGRLPQGLISLAIVARNEAESAEKMRKQGFAPLAYQRMVDAWMYAASANATSEILELVASGDLVGAKARLHEFEGLANTTEAVIRDVGTMKPDTMGGHLQMLSAFQKAIAGLASYMHAGDTTAMTKQFLDQLGGVPADQLASPDMAEAVVQMVAPTIISIARAVANSAAAKESMAIEGVKSLNYMCSLPNVHRLATSFQSAAAANVTYFETLLSITDDATRNRVAMMEPDYLTAYVSSNVTKMSGMPESLKSEWGEDSLAWGLFGLAAEELGYFKASTLISKWYSLGVQNDPYTGRPTAVEHEKAFMNMLTTAERKARENARAAKVAAGSIPVQARIAYQNARVLREGDLADKLQALEMFWAASSYSQTAVMLARN